MVQLWTGQTEMGVEDENNMEERSGHEKSGVGLVSMGLEHLVWM
jgi:hypothetical protein